MYFDKGIIPYRGGKTRVRKQIVRALFEHGHFDEFVEPMVGGGSVALMVARIWRPDEI